jgi:hypothetical protein
VLRRRIEATPLDRSLRAFRAAHQFQLWIRVVLSPAERESFERWAQSDDKPYGVLVRRYLRTQDEIDRELLLDDIQDLIVRSSPRPKRQRSFARKFAAIMERT